MTDMMKVGCPYCGASSNEPCINQQDMSDMDVPHSERIAFAAVVGRNE